MDAERGEGEAPAPPVRGETSLGRRAFLVGGGLAALSLGGAALAAGPDGVREAYAQIVCGALPEPPKTLPGTLQRSRVDGRRVVIGLPPDARGALTVVVMLHSTTGDARTPFDRYAVARHLAASGGHFAVASIDDWPSADLTGELLPYLRECNLDTRRIGLLGWSAGGAGALRLAAELGPERVSAVAATAPAVSAARAPLQKLVDIPVWLGCGERDLWAPQTETMLKGLKALGATAEGGISGGCRDTAYRRRVLPEQLAFFSRHMGRRA
ncbi:alpha/beta hydrolase-fold protein [Streptosporangium sp. NPDC087985]|uniref:alpha/beta hydrolase-fold protein n=1 Tax=Streptosporangium sp. NPDC087985 TaxID=3366196 RepID=UPI0038281561